MGKIAKGVKKIHFTMLYGNYCYIFIENFPKKFSPCAMTLPNYYDFKTFLTKLDDLFYNRCRIFLFCKLG